MPKLARFTAKEIIALVLKRGFVEHHQTVATKYFTTLTADGRLCLSTAIKYCIPGL